MNVLSTNIAQPRDQSRNGVIVKTGIYKEPVASIAVRKFFVEGDTVADLRVHGGEFKAVYVYASEHYPFWQQEFPALTLPWGMFGENITTSGLFENELFVGSYYQFGTAVLEVTEPRFPCHKLATKFGSDDMIKRFLHSTKSGSYFSVIEEGVVRPGDSIRLIKPSLNSPSILSLVQERITKD